MRVTVCLAQSFTQLPHFAMSLPLNSPELDLRPHPSPHITVTLRPAARETHRLSSSLQSACLTELWKKKRLRTDPDMETSSRVQPCCHLSTPPGTSWTYENLSTLLLPLCQLQSYLSPRVKCTLSPNSATLTGLCVFGLWLLKKSS